MRLDHLLSKEYLAIRRTSGDRSDVVSSGDTPGRCAGYSFDTSTTTTFSTALERERVGAGDRLIRTHCSALRVRILEHLENSIASASIYSQVMKGLRWMPWRQEPMKDASGCEKLRGAAERAEIRRCPNGETRLGSCPVTRA